MGLGLKLVRNALAPGLLALVTVWSIWVVCLPARTGVAPWSLLADGGLLGGALLSTASLWAPMALFGGVFGALRRWREDGQWRALETLGVGPGALTPWLLLIGAAAAVVMALLTREVEPRWASWMRGELATAALKAGLSGVTEGQSSALAEGITVRVRSREPGAACGVMLELGPPWTQQQIWVFARQARWWEEAGALRVQLTEGSWHREGLGLLEQGHFEVWEGPLLPPGGTRPPWELGQADLQERIRQMEDRGRQPRAERGVLERRVALPWLCVPLALWAALLALYVPGRLPSAAAAALLIGGCALALRVLEVGVAAGHLPPRPAAWAPTLLLVAALPMGWAALRVGRVGGRA